MPIADSDRGTPRRLTPDEFAAFARDFPEFVAPMPSKLCQCTVPVVKAPGWCVRCAKVTK